MQVQWLSFWSSAKTGRCKYSFPQGQGQTDLPTKVASLLPYNITEPLEQFRRTINQSALLATYVPDT